MKMEMLMANDFGCTERRTDFFLLGFIIQVKNLSISFQNQLTDQIGNTRGARYEMF